MLGQLQSVHCGDVKKNREAIHILNSDEDQQEAVGRWIQRGKYGRLLELWAQGLTLDWNKVQEADSPMRKPARVSLPTYPFAPERCWVDGESRLTMRAAANTTVKSPGEPTKASQKAIPEVVDQPAAEDNFSDVMLIPKWDVFNLPTGCAPWPAADEAPLVIGGTPAERQAVWEQYPNAEMMVLPGGGSIEDLTNRLEQTGVVRHVIWIAPKSEANPEVSRTEVDSCGSQPVEAEELFRVIKAFLLAGYANRGLGLTVITDQASRADGCDGRSQSNARVCPRADGERREGVSTMEGEGNRLIRQR